MAVIVQSTVNPERVLRALEELVDAGVQEVRIAVAYATLSGSRLLHNILQARAGITHWATVNKTLVTAVDYGITEPDALSWWMEIPNASVLLQNAELIVQGTLVPAVAFHPKYYEFRYAREVRFAIGSANLTERALTLNREAVALHRGSQREADSLWNDLIVGAVPLSKGLLAEYRRVRRRNPPIAEPTVPTPPRPPGRTLWSAITVHGFDPTKFENFWVETGSMTSGGSRNQLELPRGANHFFGFFFDDYNQKPGEIGRLTLELGSWTEGGRSLRWHGSNMMERLNLPTGPNYSNSLVLFRRKPDGFQVHVSLATSDRAKSWRNASYLIGHAYRVGEASPRWCGFF